MGNKELFKTVLFGGFQKEEVWNYMQEVEAEIEGGRQVAERAQQEYAQQLEARLEESLSDLEKRVLYLHLRGTDYKTIAKLLDKSPKSVDNALQRIKAKTQKILEKEKE